MNSVMTMFIGFVLLGHLAACVEVRDQNEEVTPAAVSPERRSQQYPAMEFVGDMYLYQGRFLSKQEFDYEIYKSNGVVDRTVRDLDFHFESLTLAEGARLFTLGHRVRIHATVFESHGGHIETFPAGQTAPHGIDGRSGGYLVLKVGQAQGSLVVIMRGENGAHGSDGKEPGPELDGRNPSDRVRLKCNHTESLVGPKGANGLPGYPGTDGTDGGDSGFYELHIPRMDQFEHVIERLPGHGGLKGAGGRGGFGAPPPLVIIPGITYSGFLGESRKRCTFESGGPGDNGKRGADGKSGQDGATNRRCVVIGGQATCD